MTQKHFIAIAAILAGDLAVNSYSPDGQAAIRGTILSMADYFSRENPRFKRSVFYRACGLTSDGCIP